MNDNRMLNVLLNILQIFMQMVVAVALVNTLLHGFMRYEVFQVFNTLYIGVVVLAFYIIKKCIKSGKIAWILHFLAVISVVFAVEGSMEDKAMVLVPAIALGYYSIKRTSQEPFLILDMGILAGCFIIGGTIPAESGVVIPFYGTIIYVISYVIWFNLKNLNEFVSEHGSFASFNAAQAINVNSVMLGIFIIIVGIVMYVMPRLNLQSLIMTVLLMLWRGFLVIWKAFDFDMPKRVTEIEKTLVEKSEGQPRQDLSGMLEMSKGNEVLNIIAMVFAAIVFVCMLVMVIKSLKNLKYSKYSNMDVKEFIKPRFNGERKAGNKVKINFFFNTDNDVAVRRLYHDLIKKRTGKTKSVDKTDTPTEITTGAVGWDESTREMTELYEKARYSNTNISDDEVGRMREFRKRI